MPDAKRLPQIAQQLREGKVAPSATVREFLTWFGAQRRGYWIVTGIRDELSRAGLQTEPDLSPRTSIRQSPSRLLPKNRMRRCRLHNRLIWPQRLASPYPWLLL